MGKCQKCDGDLMIIEQNKKIERIPLTKWNKHFEYPSQGTMRNICARRKENGAECFLSMINGRFYVHVERFHDWMDKQSQFKKEHA